MSLTKITEVAIDRRGRRNTRGGREYTRTFWAWSNTTSETVDTVLSTTGIPQRFDEHPNNSAALCVDVAAVQDERQRYKWVVTCTYTSEYDPPSVLPDDPADEEPEISEDTVDIIVAMDEDFDEVAVLNSAGDAFDPPLTKEEAASVIRYAKNIAEYDVDLWDGLRKTTNNQAVTIIGWTDKEYSPNTLWLKSIRVTKATRNSYSYFRVEAEIHYKSGGHLLKVLDQGRRGYEDDLEPLTGAPPHVFMDNAGNALQSPTLLTTDGVKTDTPEYKSFRNKRSYTWADFPFVEVVV